MKRILFFVFLFLFLVIKIVAQTPKNEIRAVWIATNEAMDWPTKPFKTLEDIDKQKEELKNILCCLKRANFNMVFFQIRLRGDVVYDSKIEPISPFIRNMEYKETYDPLAFVIEECHKLGLECHAWLVTYLLGTTKNKEEVNCSQAIKQNKSRIRAYKGSVYLDPGDPGTNKYLLSLVKEIVEKYDIDGVHMDYIRYPEQLTGFPDDITYKLYGKGESKTEWRKNNINQFVSELYDTVKDKKPWVQVSSAVYRNALEVCQDIKQWFQMGKHDFIVPMMYYFDNSFCSAIQDLQTKSYGRFVVPGLGIYRIDEKYSNWDVHMITEQIQSSRQCHTEGNAFFRAIYLVNNKKGIMDEIKNKFYNYPALLPPLTWLKKTRPIPPKHLRLTVDNSIILLNWESANCSKKENVFYNVYRSKNEYIDINDASNLITARIANCKLSIPIDSSCVKGYYYAVTSYDRYHNESEVSELVYFKAKH